MLLIIYYLLFFPSFTITFSFLLFRLDLKCMIARGWLKVTTSSLRETKQNNRDPSGLDTAAASFPLSVEKPTREIPSPSPLRQTRARTRTGEENLHKEAHSRLHNGDIHSWVPLELLVIKSEIINHRDSF